VFPHINISAEIEKLYFKKHLLKTIKGIDFAGPDNKL